MFIGIYIFNTLSQEEESVSFGIPSTTTKVFTLGNISGDYNCYQWSGSSNFNQCIVGSEISNILKFDESISNLFVFDNYIFAVQKNGLIYKINESYEYVMFLDIRSKDFLKKFPQHKRYSRSKKSLDPSTLLSRKIKLYQKN